MIIFYPKGGREIIDLPGFTANMLPYGVTVHLSTSLKEIDIFKRGPDDLDARILPTNKNKTEEKRLTDNNSTYTYCINQQLTSQALSWLLHDLLLSTVKVNAYPYKTFGNTLFEEVHIWTTQACYKDDVTCIITLMTLNYCL